MRFLDRKTQSEVGADVQSGSPRLLRTPNAPTDIKRQIGGKRLRPENPNCAIGKEIAAMQTNDPRLAIAVGNEVRGKAVIPETGGDISSPCTARVILKHETALK
jgi:hypothetical protein